MTKNIGTNQPDSYKGIKILEQVCRKLHLTRLKDIANSCYPKINCRCHTKTETCTGTFVDVTQHTNKHVREHA